MSMSDATTQPPAPQPVGTPAGAPATIAVGAPSLRPAPPGAAGAAPPPRSLPIPDALKSKNLSDDLKKRIALHYVWRQQLQNGGVPVGGIIGSQIRFGPDELAEQDLSGLDLSEAIFQKCHLDQTKMIGAILTGADFTRSTLIQVDFTDAILTDAKLNNARLKEVSFLDAILTNADLTGVKGLKAENLAGAVLTDAVLPPEPAAFDGLRTAAEMSKNCGRYFVGLLAACVFAILTIASSSDLGLFLDASTVALPILGTQVGAVGLHFIAPLILLLAFVYFHLELQRLWDTFAKLPAVFPDGRSLDEKAYPWILGILVRFYSARLRHPDFVRTDAKPLLLFQKWLTIILAWYCVPLTLVFFWSRYIHKHDWTGSRWQVGLILVSIAAAWTFHWLTAWTLSRQKKKTDRPIWKAALLSRHNLINLYYFLVAFAALWVCTENLILAIPPKDKVFQTARPTADAELPGSSLRKRIPRLLSLFGYTPYAQLDYAEFPKRPDKWLGVTKEELDQIPVTLLMNRDLRYAHLNRAFLVHVDLTGTNLNGAQMLGADLRHAVLTGARLTANLQEADLRGVQASKAHFAHADLTGAIFGDTDPIPQNLDRKQVRALLEQPARLGTTILQSADFTEARMANAHLRGADLQGADLQGADLKDADLRGADLEEAALKFADLRGADLQGADLKNAVFKNADLKVAFIEDADLKNADMEEADLKFADLQRADLQGADLKNADLKNADFKNAGLKKADLTTVKNLTEGQIRDALIDAETKLPPRFAKLKASILTNRQKQKK